MLTLLEGRQIGVTTYREIHLADSFQQWTLQATSLLLINTEVQLMCTVHVVNTDQNHSNLPKCGRQCDCLRLATDRNSSWCIVTTVHSVAQILAW